MSGRIYTVSFEATAVTAQVDFFELDAAAEKPIELLGFDLSQSSDTGDAAEEMLRIKIIRGHTTSGSGGTATTPRPVNLTDTAAGFAAETCNTTIASAGTGVDLYAGAVNIRTGSAPLWFPEGCEIATSGTALLVVRLMAAPADSLTMSGTAWVRELG